MVELLINGENALEKYGVRMGTGFLDIIEAPCQMKEYIENDSRLEHGIRITVNNPKISSRSITLPFTIQGKTVDDYKKKKSDFYDLLYSGRLSVKIPSRSEDVYHLVYTGGGTSYSHSRKGDFCKFSAKFVEPDPSNRK